MGLSNTALKDVFQQYIHKSRYARWVESVKRRETWDETIQRYFDFFVKHLKENHNYKLTGEELSDLEQGFLNLASVGSMRALMTAGEALERDNTAGYNCSFMSMDRQRAFDELAYILLCGTGSGFSVERQLITKLPTISEQFHETDTTIHVADSKIGWAKAFRELISLLYIGQIPNFDFSKVRPKGERLKTFGGRSSGPDPLEELFMFVIEKFKGATGRKLNSLEIHDIDCKVGQIIVVGGVRRAALISLSNLSDERMRHAKSGEWWVQNIQRRLANNSICYTEKPDIGIYMKEWLSLYESKSGERGIFNVLAAQKQVRKSNAFRKAHGFTHFRDPLLVVGTNPCAEILLRDRQFCNLSEVILRSTDTYEDIAEKVRLATMLGTFQSSLTNFRYLSKEWKKNCEEERLLGVSFTGIQDNNLMNGRTKGLPNRLESLLLVAIRTNLEWAEKLGINPSLAITCVKPSGTLSSLAGTSSGIHARHSEYYIRTARTDKKDPICQFMIDQKVPYEDDVTDPNNTTVFSFPIRSPKNSIFRNDRTAVEQLKMWKVYQDYWSEHKPSITVHVDEHEWMETGAWVYQNFDDISGVSFLPKDNHIYKQAPFQEITKAEYNEYMKSFPKEIDWAKLSDYEQEDNTTGSQELACTGGSCEII